MGIEQPHKFIREGAQEMPIAVQKRAVDIEAGDRLLGSDITVSHTVSTATGIDIYFNGGSKISVDRDEEFDVLRN